jgi:hypothetical protein
VSEPQEYPQIELNTLSAVNGNAASLSAPSAHAHPGARDFQDTLEFLPHVGNLTRNVILRSQNPSGVRGHVVFTSRADVDIRYTQFQDLGRTRNFENLDNTTYNGDTPTHIGTNQIGRYALHLHHLFGPTSPQSSSYQFTLIGNVIQGALKWGITIHNSHYGLVQDNVLYDVAGAGIMFEDGNESFNRIQGNFVVKIPGDGNRGDAPEIGKEGTGIWMRGGNNYYVNNVVANTRGYLYGFWHTNLNNVTIPAFQGADPMKGGEGISLNMQEKPILDFSNNEGYSGGTALTIWDHWATAPSFLRSFRVWHTLYAFFGYPHSNVVFDGWVVRGHKSWMKDPTYQSMAIDFGDYNGERDLITNVNIQNMPYGVRMPIIAEHLGTNFGVSIIQDSYLNNYTNIVYWTSFYNGGGQGLPPKRSYIRNVKFGTPSVANHNEYPKRNIWAMYRVSDQANLVVADEIHVEAYNGAAGDNFRIYYKEQAPGFLVPQTQGQMIGAPVGGLTNAQTWAVYNIAIAGSVAPCSTTRAEIGGFVCAPTSQSPAPPAAPTNLRVVSQ